MRLACARHLRDLAEGPARGLRWDWPAAERVIGFFRDVLRLNGGEHEGAPFVLTPWQAFLVGSLFGWKGPDGTRRFRVAFCEIGKGNGKALALDTPIPTPGGWSAMGLLRVGDEILDELGQTCRVLATSEVMADRPCFRVVFDDGESVVADAGHLWLTEARKSSLPARGASMKGVPLSARGAWRLRVRTTAEIAATLRYKNGPYLSANHSVALAAPLDLPDRDLPVPPYVLGAWLGDGDSDCARLTCSFADIGVVEQIVAEGVSARPQKRHSETTGRFGLGGGSRGGRFGDRAGTLNARLRRLGLLGRKRIPPAYLRASKSQRLALLQGLLDTDGSIGASGQIEFTSTSPVLAAGVHELALSLGLKVTTRECDATLNGRVVGRKYRVLFFAPPTLPVFRLPRKLERQAPRHSRRRLSGERRIVSCEPVQSVPVRCIKVDSASSMFLCGRGMIPTHNSPLAAGIGLFLLTADGEARAEVYSAAVDRDQAGILFRDAVAMVDQSPALDSRITRSGGPGREFNLAHLASGSFFRPIASESTGRGKSGPRPHGGLLDEVHEHRSAAMVEFMRAGTKGRRQALILLITNSGFDRNSVCWQYHEMARAGLEAGTLQDHVFAYVCGLDEGDSPLEDESCWPKANPNLGVSITHKYLREQVAEARDMPSKQGVVLRLNFCRWTEAATRWIGPDVWARNAGEVPDEELEGCPSWWGLDLSRVRDLTALVGVFELPDGRLASRCRFWLPGQGLADREREDRNPYLLWRDRGLLATTPGPVIAAADVAGAVAAELDRPGVAGLAFDRFRMNEILDALDEAGFRYRRCAAKPGEAVEPPAGEGVPLVDWGQGFVTMAPAIDAAERAMQAGLLRHGGHPVLTMCAANATVQGDKSENRRFVKAGETARDDGIVALVMALGLRERLAAPDRSDEYLSDGGGIMLL